MECRCDNDIIRASQCRNQCLFYNASASAALNRYSYSGDAVGGHGTSHCDRPAPRPPRWRA